MVRFLSMRRQYIDSERKHRFTTETLGAMTTPSLTGYELDHEVLRIENLLLEQLNQLALAKLEVRKIELGNQDLIDSYEELLCATGLRKKRGESDNEMDENDIQDDNAIEEQQTELDENGQPKVKPPRKLKKDEMYDKNGNIIKKDRRTLLLEQYQEFIESYGATTSSLLDGKKEFESILQQSVSKLQSQIQTYQTKIENLRLDLRDEYFKYLYKQPLSGLNELTPDEHEEIKTLISEQIVPRIRPTITSLFPWERMFYARLADPTHSTLQGAGVQLDLQDLRSFDKNLTEHLEELEQEFNSQTHTAGFQHSLETARIDALNKKNANYNQMSNNNKNTNINNDTIVDTTSIPTQDQEQQLGSKKSTAALPFHHPASRIAKAKKKSEEEGADERMNIMKQRARSIGFTIDGKSADDLLREKLLQEHELKQQNNPNHNIEGDDDEDDIIIATSFLPPIGISEYHLEITETNIRRQHKFATFNIPYEDLELESYLPLPYVLHNILFIFEELFDIDIIQMPTQYQVNPTDSDTINKFKSLHSNQVHMQTVSNSLIHHVWERNVLAFNIFDRDISGQGQSITGEKPILGTFYLDLMARQGKSDSIESQFLSNSYQHTLFNNPHEATVSEEVFKHMKRQHFLNFFIQQAKIPYSEQLIQEIETAFNEVKDEPILMDPIHNSKIIYDLQQENFTPEIYDKALRTIRQVSQNHFNTAHNSNQIPIKKSQLNALMDHYELNRHLTTNARAPPITVITFPLTDTQILPTTSEIDSLIDDHYQAEIIKYQRTGLQPNLFPTQLATKLSTRANTLLDHAAATTQEYKESHTPIFNEVLNDYFKARRVKLTQLQNLPHLINKSKLHTTPILLDFTTVRSLFHELGHMIMHTMDHTPYLNSKSLLHNQEIHELISHLCEQFLVHTHPNQPKPRPQNDIDRQREEEYKKSQGKIKINKEVVLESTSLTPHELDSRLADILEDIPKMPSFGTVHALTQHYSYLNHGDVTHLHNMYHPDTQYMYKTYVQQLAQYVFPSSSNNNKNNLPQRLRVLVGNSYSDYTGVIDYKVFAQTLKYLSNYHNNKNAPHWRNALIEFDRSMDALENAHVIEYQDELGLGHPVLHQAAEFGIKNDQSSLQIIEKKLETMTKSKGRIIPPNVVDKLIYHAIHQADIVYDEEAVEQLGMLPHHAVDVIPTLPKERKKQLQKLFSRYPPKPPLSYYNNLISRSIMADKQQAHSSIIDALVDHHLHIVEFQGNVDDSPMLKDLEDPNKWEQPDGNYDTDDEQLQIEDQSLNNMNQYGFANDDDFLSDSTEMTEDDHNINTNQTSEINNKPKPASNSKWNTATIDADIIDSPDAASKPSTDNSNNAHTNKSQQNSKDKKSVEEPTVVFNNSTGIPTDGRNPLGGAHLSLDYFTSKIFNYQQFPQFTEQLEPPITQLKQRPLKVQKQIIAQMAAHFTDQSQELQQKILKKQFEQRPKSTLLLDRLRAMREETIYKQNLKLNKLLPPIKRPIDVSLQQSKYMLILPQYMFVHQSKQRYHMGLSQAQGTLSFTNNIFRTLEFVLENPPLPEIGQRKLETGSNLSEDPLGIQIYTPAIPTISSVGSVKPFAHDVDHLYSSYAGKLYSYPYAEMLAEEIFNVNFLSQTGLSNKNHRKGYSFIKQQRKNSIRLIKDSIYNIKSDIPYDIDNYIDLLRLSTTSPLIPNTPIYGQNKQISVLDQQRSNDNYQGELEQSELLGGINNDEQEQQKPLTVYNTQKPKPTQALPFGYYKSPYISKPTISYLKQYFNSSRTKKFKNAMKLFQEHNVMQMLSQFSLHSSHDELLHFYKKKEVGGKNQLNNGADTPLTSPIKTQNQDPKM